MRARLPLVSLLCLALSTPVAALQSTPPYGESLTWSHDPLAGMIEIPWPSSLGAGPFRAVAPGSFLGHDSPSLFVLYGDDPIFVFEPTQYVGMYNVDASQTFTDIATLHSPTPAAPDWLLAIGPDGLRRLTYNGTRFATSSLGSSLWANGTRVIAGDLGSAPVDEILALDANGDLLIGVVNFTTGVLSETLVPLVHPAVDLVVVDWDDDGTADIVTHNASGLDVYALDGTLVDDVRLLTFGGALHALEGADGLRDCVVWSTRSINDDRDVLYLLNSAGYEGPTDLTFAPNGSGTPIDIELFALATGNADGEDGDELLVGHEAFMQMPVLTNQSSNPTASATFEATLGNYELFDLSPNPAYPASGNHGRPAFADLDHDPYLSADSVVPLDNTNRLVIRRGVSDRVDVPEIPPATFEDWYDPWSGATLQPWGSAGGGPPTTSDLGTVWEYLNWSSYYEYVSGSTGTLHLTFKDIPEALLLNFEAIQVRVWSQDDPVTTPSDTYNIAYSNKVHPLVATSGPGALDQFVSITVPHAGTEWPDREHYYMVFRFVNYTTGGGSGVTVDSSSSGLVVGLTMPTDLDDWTSGEHESYTYLDGLAIAQPIALVAGAPPTPPSSGGFLAGTASIGAIIPIASVPPFGDGGAPTPGAPTAGSVTSRWEL